jgi:hypothetical protein
MAQIQYERVKKRLVPDDVSRATWLCRNPGRTVRVIEWADTESIGLVLRITKRDCNWLIRRRDSTIRIGSCNEIGVVAQNSERPRKAGDFRATAIPSWA